ncbi:hypothetical protein LTR85_001557 [Meristemomyces frigidus]|nr:hypothetical protein LTR85_001557 [Meristemomyces frigidus]
MALKEKKRKGGSKRVAMPLSVEEAVKAAYDRDEISGAVYDTLAQAGLGDMREDKIWRDTVMVSPPAELLPLPQAVECQDEEAPVACCDEESPVLYYAEEAPLDVETTEERLAKACTTDERVEAASVEDEITEEMREISKMEAKPDGPNGHGFLWCFRCGRVDVVIYSCQTLPAQFKGPVVGLVNHGMVLIVCGKCRTKPAHPGHTAAEVEEAMTSSFQQLGLIPRMFEGAEGVLAAQAILQQEVPILTDSRGVVYRDVNGIIQGLRVEDRLASVDLERFRRGARDRLLLPYLAGGLMSSA